ncbi:hypothetical protein Moror_14152 [Moniliophthora roreri MCA 2997]|uniref:Uncharacterized protein n=1 Tax=Moniliophthora roreri (strain MCA 2997) TaxID=1381753 RepID=V2X6N6_MONRO|nr:hypothetical protein Moror_14152 [Moniliophthora roreri MCA 2997]
MCFLINGERQFTCGHRARFKRERVDCNNRYCAISRSHRYTEAHDCATECEQNLKPDQDIIFGRVNRLCDECLNPIAPD